MAASCELVQSLRSISSCEQPASEVEKSSASAIRQPVNTTIPTEANASDPLASLSDFVVASSSNRTSRNVSFLQVVCHLTCPRSTAPPTVKAPTSGPVFWSSFTGARSTSSVAVTRPRVRVSRVEWAQPTSAGRQRRPA